MNNDFFPGDIFDGHYRLLDELSADGGTADVWLALDLNTIDSNLGDDDEAADHLPDDCFLVHNQLSFFS